MPGKPKTIKMQIVRGIAGFGLIAAAVYAFMARDYPVAFVCMGLSFIPLRGCPSCWLLETCEVAIKKNAPAPGDKPDEPQQR